MYECGFFFLSNYSGTEKCNMQCCPGGLETSGFPQRRSYFWSNSLVCVCGTVEVGGKVEFVYALFKKS